ncbi:iron(III) transport system ATP-binding protein [Microbacterium sp. W4I4]|uniref:ABC transporter ATP-binding protein n=1 Tax=Microbacterium sp. W4I4 TaxID=3042295 RepID=UPI0027814EE0|nr:ABC transporter ATP-binding protein [Microbacterium sp. W4I4]MDQ0615180.1 iron(III) transport system ATP-binding protein [Microbacterium sp. W4I4]
MNTVPVLTDTTQTTPDAATATGGAVRLEGVTKLFHAKKTTQAAVDSISLDIPAGSFVTLLGPSGCGKTTTLRMIAGFERPTSGDILLDGVSMLGTTPDKRPMSMVFQSYALFPHLSVRDNVAFGLKLKQLDRRARQAKVDEGLQLMGIEQYADRYPHQLSGGQQQRVALARALVMEPKIVLFDEPLSNLDASLRVRMRAEIRALQQRLGLTAVFVTHDQSEALTMSDIIVVMNAGRIEQVGAPTEIYRRPHSRFVASFLGTSNFVDGTLRSVREESDGVAVYSVETVFGTFTSRGVAGSAEGDTVSIVMRAEDISVGGPSEISGRVVAVAFDGSIVNYDIETDAGRMRSQAPGSSVLRAVGDEVALTIDSEAMWVVASGETAAR